ncbi:oligosaccharide flippase family protein [Conexibacter sp. W3-3-2]|uniref:flippase n=1 Tax=Conexibacter sp. W3-3-2 TaxID=2675227 RepID=UPI0012B74E17|nr:flippase [Conexibacter sp. W3-3-2]MTD46217.1 oligosaccharide flippase family protein [Conexibacter sp. W3-3-2]
MTEDVLDGPDAGQAAMRGGILRVVGYAAGTVLSLVAVALLFRELGVEDGGRYVTVLTVVALAGGLTDAGLTAIGVREYAIRTDEDRDMLMRDLLGVRVILTTVGIAGGLLFALLAGYDATMLSGVVVVGMSLLLVSTASAYGVGLMARLRMGWVTAADVARQAVSAATVVLLALLNGSLAAFFWTPLVGAVAALGITVFAVRGLVPLRPSFHPKRVKSLLADTLAYTAATALGSVYFRVSVVIVSLASTAQETGYFGAAFRGVEVLIVVPQLLVSTVFPIIARAAHLDRDRLAYAIGRVFDVMLILGLAVMLGLVIGAGPVIEVVAGPEFAPAADVLRIQAVGLALSFAGSAWAYAALSLRLHREVLVVNACALLVSVALVLTLAGPHGAVGAAIGTTIAEFTMVVALAIAVRRTGVPLNPDRRALVRVVGAAAVAATAVLLPLPDLAQAVIALGVFGGLLLALRALPSEVLELVRR